MLCKVLFTYFFFVKCFLKERKQMKFHSLPHAIVSVRWK